MTSVVDLSGGTTPKVFPPSQYFPHPSMVPRALRMTGTEPLPLSVLRDLGSCSDDGPDTVQAMIEASTDLSTDPAVEVPVGGGLTVLRSLQLQADGTRKVVAWYATVSGLTFHADADGRVYVDGPSCRVILYDPASPAWQGKPFQPTVWAKEDIEPPDANGLGGRYDGAGKSKRYPSYAALVEARNAARKRGTHGRVPDAVVSLLGSTPMIGNTRTTTVAGADRTEPDGLAVRRVGQRWTMRLDDATAKRLHGERADSRQAVLRYDTAVEANAGDDVGHAAMQLLREFDTETAVVVVGVMMNAYDVGNRHQRIGAADLARIRGIELTRGSAKRRFGAMSELLANVVIEVRPVSPKPDGTYYRLPLFVNQGEVVVPGGHRLPLVTLNDTLYRAMREKGHGVMLDRRLLTVDLNTHEWEFRIAAALVAQWSIGWVRNGYAKGKRLTRSARVLLSDAGIPYDIAAERRKRGATAVRLKFASVLDGLVGLRSDLKSWKRTKEAADPADDVYEFVPSADYAARLTQHRQPALAEPTRTTALPTPTKRKRNKATSRGAS